jgi:urease accessory protein
VGGVDRAELAGGHRAVSLRANARLEAIAVDGALVLSNARSDPPFAIRRCGDRVMVAGSAASPVGGDQLSLDVVVGSGARLDLGTVAATMVWPGAEPGRSEMSTSCVVGARSHLDWRPEPTVSVIGSDHVITTHVELAATATCRLVDELSLGRHGEPPGALEWRTRVERDGRVLVHHAERFGPDVAGHGSVVGVGAARHVCSAVLVGVDAGRARTRVDGAAAGGWLPIADDTAVVMAVGPNRPEVLAVLQTLAPELFTGRDRPPVVAA